MLKRVLPIFFSLYFLFALVSTQDTPSIKLSVDFFELNNIKNDILKPLIIDAINGLELPGPYKMDTSILGVSINLTAWNVTVLEHSLDWTNTLLRAVQKDTIELDVRSLTIKVETDYSILYLGTNSTGRINITINTIDATIQVKFENTTTGSKFKASISSGSITYQSMKLEIEDKAFLSWVVNQIFNIGRALVWKEISAVLTTTLNDQVVALTSEKLQLPLSSALISSLLASLNLPLTPPSIFQTYIANITVEEAPYVRYVNDSNITYQYFTATLNLLVFNNGTGEGLAIIDQDLLPFRRYFANDVQGFVCNSLIEQFFWVLLDSDIINLTLDDTFLPAKSSIRLNTTNFLMLLPGMTIKYGQGKGIYVTARTSSKFSKIVFRGGRLVAQLSVLLGFYVDKDSTNYPNKDGLKACTTCEKALELNTTIIVSLHGDNHDDEKVIFVNVISLDFPLLELIESNITIDVKAFQELLKNVAASFLPGINSGLAGGITNPVIGVFDIEHFQFKFGVDYFWVAMKFGAGAKLIKLL